MIWSWLNDSGNPCGLVTYDNSRNRKLGGTMQLQNKKALRFSFQLWRIEIFRLFTSGEDKSWWLEELNSASIWYSIWNNRCIVLTLKRCRSSDVQRKKDLASVDGLVKDPVKYQTQLCTDHHNHTSWMRYFDIKLIAISCSFETFNYTL